MNFKQLDKDLMLEISKRGMDQFTSYGEANGQPFTRQGIIMAMQGLGRLQEIIKKCTQTNQMYRDPLFLQIIHTELRNLLNKKKPDKEEGNLFNLQDLVDLTSGIRELMLQNVESALITQLMDETLAHLATNSL